MTKGKAATDATLLVAKMLEAGHAPDFAGGPAERGQRQAEYLSALLKGLRDTLQHLDE